MAIPWTNVRQRDWREQLRTAGLERSATQLVEHVVRETRLSATEKLQVTQELVAHFEDGTKQGYSTSELVETFGDPKLAAKLIRRGKIRNRTMANKLWRGGLWGSVGLLASYLILLWYFNQGVPRPSVDFLAQLNQVVGKTAEDDRAWPIYRGPMSKLKFIEGPGGKFEEIYYFYPDADDDRRLVLPSDYRLVLPSDGEQWDRAVNKLTDSRELLDALRRGGQKHSFGLELQIDPRNYSPEDQVALFPNGISTDGPFGHLRQKGQSPQKAEAVANSSLAGILLPHVQTMRNCTRILEVDTRWAMTEGDWERAVQNVEAMFGFARQVSEHRFLVCTLVGCAISGMACDVVDDLMANGSHEWSADHLRRLQQAIERDSVWDWVSLDSEKMFFDDLLQRTFTDDGRGDGRITPVGIEVMRLYSSMNGQMIRETEGVDISKSYQEILEKVMSPMSMFLMPSRREYAEAADRFYREANERFFGPYQDESIIELEKSISSRHMLLGAVAPSIIQVRNAVARTEMNRHSTAAAIAIYRYQCEHGRWPESLDSLVGDYLTALPLDPLNEQPLCYVVTPTGFKLYGYGCDGDDDGGRPIMVLSNGNYAPPDTEPSELRRQYAGEFILIMKPRDGDWVAWPRK